jgi:SpoVK/Ycf46/Vps4 family AAA+-type ATPase
LIIHPYTFMTQSTNQTMKQTILPCKELHDQWERLIFEDKVKSRLMNYVYTGLRFSEAGVNDCILGINRVCLLQGPPGTGKTTLCKALAQVSFIFTILENFNSFG